MAGRVWAKLAAIALAMVLLTPLAQAQLLQGGSDGQPNTQVSLPLQISLLPVSLNIQPLFINEDGDDFDGDSVPDYDDNCFEIANRDQWDIDGDGLGDACDDDIDGDYTENQFDNCPLAVNTFQSNLDHDDFGDACDDDIDGDDDTYPIETRAPLWGSGTGHTCWYANGELSCVGSHNGSSIDVPAYFGRPSKIDGGEGFTCGLVDTQLRCFGVDTAWLPNNLNQVSDFDAAGTNLCAIVGGQVQCWSKLDDLLSDVPPLDQPRKVAVGTFGACAIANNDVYCWGAYPQSLSLPLNNPVDITVGEFSICVKDDAGWHCLGGPENYFDRSAQLALGQSLSCVLEGRDVSCFGEWGSQVSLEQGIDQANYITVGANHVCVTFHNQLRCAGDVVVEQILELAPDNCPSVENYDQADEDGDGIGDACDDDIDGDGVPNAAKPVWGSGYNHSCWVANGQMECIGDNGYGPIEVPEDFPTPDKIAGGHGFTCGLADDVLSCFGQNSQWLPSPLTGVSDFDTSNDAMCAVLDGGVRCWSPIGADVPIDFLSFTNVRQLSIARDIACAIDDIGVQCWGDAIPASPYNFVNPVDVVVSHGAACVKDDLGWRCWSNKEYDDISFMRHDAIVAASDSRMCALQEDWLHCWGDSYFNDSQLDNFTVGSEHICMLHDGQLRCDGIAEQRPFELVTDNCPQIANADQKDIDGDEIGDACDDDIDNDGVANQQDTCPRDNTDRCMLDDDNDGVLNGDDNCPLIANPNQANVDGDEFGDACDDDIDNDTQLNDDDTCPRDKLNRCLWDEDFDGKFDGWDNCPTVANGDQWDTDNDGIGNSCDDDADGDGIIDVHKQVWGSGNKQTCWLTQGQMECAGNNYYGDPVPVPVDFGTPSKIAGGEGFVCGLVDDVLKCFGQSVWWLPIGLSNVSDFETGRNTLCALVDGHAQCWSAWWDTTDNVPSKLRKVQKIAVERDTACAIDESGVHCWGKRMPPPPFSVVNPVDLVVVNRGACVKDDSGWRCWGNALQDRTFSAATQLVAGEYWLCALENGQLRCWGWSVEKIMPVDMQTADFVTVGEHHICVISNGRLRCDGNLQEDRPFTFSGDNCGWIPNPDQADFDKDGLGDACDDDDDGDGIANLIDQCPRDSSNYCIQDDDSDGELNRTDNCPQHANSDQSDLDNDGVGDACDDDIDGDGVANEQDGCPRESANLCLLDDDNDGVANGVDNCRASINPDQMDLDGDGLGDPCDIDIDGDGLINVMDNCPRDNTNRCLFDDDYDGLLNGLDNCPQHANSNQADLDGDGVGDVCDDDIDGDGTTNEEDTCPSDGSNRCMFDDDSDGLSNGIDNCPLLANSDQMDQDHDGIGDVCDEDADGDGVKDSLVIGSGDDWSCWVLGQTVRCIGWESYPYPNPYETIEVPAGFGVPEKIVGGLGYICGLTQGSLQCFGPNSAWLPTDASDIVELAAHSEKLCAIKTDHRVQCWEKDAPFLSSAVPANLQQPHTLRLNDVMACVIDQHQLRCWGHLAEEMMNTVTFGTPRDVFLERNFCVRDDEGWHCANPYMYRASFMQSTSKLFGVGTVCALDGGDLRCFSSDGGYEMSLDSSTPRPQAVSAGANHVCWVANSRIKCSGSFRIDEAFPRLDNCPGTYNPDQFDSNLDGVGNACDSDNDGVRNDVDNCPSVHNPWQEDIDNDTLGDDCDWDMDNDGLANVADNCPSYPNPLQTDWDFDGLGDACDDDVDGDTIVNDDDNCPSTANRDQLDIDDDGLGNACDDDIDGDEVSNEADNCALVANNDQANLDSDAFGDSCDNDIDGDTVLNEQDNCPSVANTEQDDLDGDLLGDACDNDIDGDGVNNDLDALPRDAAESKDTDGDSVGDNADNCPLVPNTDQIDIDGDSIGDACDELIDNDNDGIANDVDNCPLVANTEQDDLDGDSLGDACDDDIDGDGVNNDLDVFPRDAAESQDTDGDSVGDNADNCPLVPNTDQIDVDGDSIGDACDELIDNDNDGVANDVDNCPSVANTEQDDLDGDLLGDACDNDIDGDGVNNDLDALPRDAAESQDTDGDSVGDNADNCPAVANTDQEDVDGDSVGDACDDLIDNDDDGIANDVDNCPLVANNEQDDLDGDLLGDACDDDIDGDGVNNDLDVFPRDTAESQDTDGDSVGDNADNCPLVPNTDQIDIDGDRIGDACDDLIDNDNDGIANDVDNCPLIANTDQANLDGDDIGDACDDDIDGDGVNNDLDVFPRDAAESQDTDGDSVGDNADNCPAVANTDQNDLDGDSLGDTCDDDIDGDSVPNDDDHSPENPLIWFDQPAPEDRIGTAKQQRGRVLVNVGDVDGDRVADYAVGSPLHTAVVTVNGKTKKLAQAGLVEVFSGYSHELLWALEGNQAKQQLGSAIVGADVNGDGLNDVAVGAPGMDKNQGAVALCIDVAAGCELQWLTGLGKGERFGSALAAGDADGDDKAELWVGAPKAINADFVLPGQVLQQQWAYRAGKERVGAVYGYTGSDLAANDTQPTQRLFGAFANGEFGAALAWLSQAQQLAIGAPTANKTGQVVLWNLAEGYTLLGGMNAKERFGAVLAANEATAYLAIAAPLAANGKLAKAGRVEVYRIGATEASYQHAWLGAEKAAEFGSAISWLASDTIAIGSPKAANPMGAKILKQAGKVEVLSTGNTTPRWQGYGTQAKAQYGFALAALDVTGDNLRELVIGAPLAANPDNAKEKQVGLVQIVDVLSDLAL